MNFVDLTLQAKEVPPTKKDLSTTLLAHGAIEDRTVGAASYGRPETVFLRFFRTLSLLL